MLSLLRTGRKSERRCFRDQMSVWNPGTCSGNVPKSSGGDVLERSRRHLGPNNNAWQTPFRPVHKPTLLGERGAHRERVELPGTAPAGSNNDGPPRVWPLASRCSVSERSSGSDQRVSFKGGNSVCPNSTLTFKPEVVGKRYLCGRMLGPGDASSPFFTNLFHCTVTRYSPAGTPS